MKIDKNLCVGLMLVGVLYYFDKDEIARDKHLQYIASVLQKKNFVLKNGTAKHRFLSTKKPINMAEASMVLRAIKELEIVHMKWDAHVKIANTAWENAQKIFDESNVVTTTDLISILLDKNPQTKKYYGFNEKSISAFKNSSQHKGKYIFRSTRAVNEIMRQLDEEIERYLSSEAMSA